MTIKEKEESIINYVSQWAMTERIKSAWVILNQIFFPTVHAFSLTYYKLDQYVIK